MLFNSLEYAVFLPTVFLVYWIIPHRFRWILLLICSYYFYMSWNAKYIVLIAATTIVSYLCAVLIEKTNRVAFKRLYVIGALIVSLGVLYLFKYFNFSMNVIEHFIPVNMVRLNLLLPVGISFYTFQTLSYVIDVYQGKIPAEKHIGIYATFVSFFPQLVAGPIERTSNLLPQINSEKVFDYGATKYGVRLILWGLYKKMVVADNLSVWVDQVFGDIRSYNGCSILLAELFFSIQIYCDFSGYSDIARGSAKLLNINLMENFKSPYWSASIREFWSRWHISLSTWFRDYVYIPLGGNRVSKIRNIINYLITFMVSGLWHGANLTFIAWGGLHGAGQIYEKSFEIKNHVKKDIYWVIRVICVFIFVTLTWVFFRAVSIHDATYALSHMLDGIGNIKLYFILGAEMLDIKFDVWIKVIFLYFMPIMLYDFFSLKTDICEWLEKQNAVLRYAYVIGMSALILMFGYVGSSSFVYFQF